MRARGAGRWVRLVVLACVCLVSAGAQAGDMLYESSAFAGPGQATGSAINAQEFLGVRFEATQPWRVEAVGGHIFQNGGSGDALFAAIVPLAGPDEYPSDATLSQAVWHTTFSTGIVSADVFVPALTYIDPGWYLLVFGGGGLFGSTGTGGMPVTNSDYGYPDYVRLQLGNWEASDPGKRFFVYGSIACVEDTSDTAIDCDEDCDNTYDDDLDGWADCQDDACWGLIRCCDADQDGFDRHEELCSFGPDCDDRPDLGPDVHPGSAETINDGVDQDCDGLERCWADVDLDSYGSTTATVGTWALTCSGAPGISPIPLDCLDSGPRAAEVHPESQERPADGYDENCDGYELCFIDGDLDGYGSHGVVEVLGRSCDRTVGVSSSDEDCDDRDPAFAPGAAEIPGDGLDQDCDNVDSCYADMDGDGYGVPTVVRGGSMDCAGLRLVSENADDCDDRVPAGILRHPGAVDLPANGVDEDCDGLDACFADLDGDGHGGFVIVPAGAADCGAAAGLSALPDDCDDTSAIGALIYPGAAEIPGDGVDQDCNDADSCFFDLDYDGYGGQIAASINTLSCDTAPGYSSTNDDCLDAGAGAAVVHPRAVEVPDDGVDQDCDGTDSCLVDLDGDTFGSGAVVDRVGAVCGDDPGEGAQAGDCDDASSSVAPGMPEVVADGVDQDCDGLEGCFQDLDDDRWGTTRVVPAPFGACGRGGQAAAISGDCDDADERIHPTLGDWPYDGIDQDCDGADRHDVDHDGQDWVQAGGTDCDDTDGLVHPGAPEVYNLIDDDCDGEIDEGFVDYDDDRDGYTELGGDCDDGRVQVRPGGVEVCDGLDQDCNGAIDDQTPCNDDDLDGWTEIAGDCNDADPSVSPSIVDIPDNGVDDDCDGVMVDTAPDVDRDGYAVSGGDCAPFLATVFPHAPELADGVDNDCDGIVDEGTVFFDDDGDGYAEPTNDCDDHDRSIFPGAAEVVNGRDDDCDGTVDEGLNDADADGALTVDDCDDGDPFVAPGRPERANGVDDDCDGAVDEGLVDIDGDGWTRERGDCHDLIGWVNPEAPEICDGLDNDCDGVIDPGCDGVIQQEVPVDVPSAGCASAPRPAGLWLLLALVARRRTRAKA